MPMFAMEVLLTFFVFMINLIYWGLNNENYKDNLYNVAFI